MATASGSGFGELQAAEPPVRLHVALMKPPECWFVGLCTRTRSKRHQLYISSLSVARQAPTASFIGGRKEPRGHAVIQWRPIWASRGP